MMKRLDRRTFTTGMTAAALAAAMRPAFLSAQGTPANGEATEYTQRRPLPTFNPSGDQVFRITGPIVDPVTIDPALVRDLSSAFLSRLAFRGLVVFDAPDQTGAIGAGEKGSCSDDGDDDRR